MNDNGSNALLINNLANLKVSDAVIRNLSDRQIQGVEIKANAQGLPTLLAHGKSMYPTEDTLPAVAREAAGLLGDQKPDLVVFFGLGLGFHLEFLRKFSKAAIIVFEPDLDVVGAVLSEIPLTIERTTLVTNPGHLAELVQDILEFSPNGMLAGALPAWVEHHPGPFSQFRNAIGQAMGKVELDRRTRAAYSAQWVSHMADNLPQYIGLPDLQSLGNDFNGKPAILVGAGPSLDGSLEMLRQAKGKTLICAVHTAVMPLLKAGIIPDLAVILEGQDLVHYFEGLEELQKVTLVASVQTHPKHFNLGFGRYMGLSMAGNAVSDWMLDAFAVPALPSSASVSCVSFSMLHALGADPLILVGMDCALTGKRSHARQSIQGLTRLGEKLSEGRMTFDVEGEETTGEWNTHEVVAWGGQGTELARVVYSVYRHWFEGVSQTWAADRQLINATEGGARIHGFQEMRLEDVLQQFCQDDLPAEELIAKGLINAEPFDSGLLADVVAAELVIIGEAGKVAAAVDQQAVRVLRKLESGQLSTVQPVLDQLGKLEKELQELTKKTRLLNTLVGFRARELTRNSPPPKGKVEGTIHSVRQSREITRVVLDGSEELIQRFGPVIESLRNLA